ncbi:outer membrane protein assembly factor [Mesonia sp. K7]|uniref:BamA/OMP85 family outer membrane protein n=1 Tax=Mesonia sp. K7 TaxID=2218606 RepID=UPI000DA7A488|nr:POTRA domain-containing protein [Mesonia sp. K7]PZD78738.1 outer membrane protein assembly factor BamA [Mesonia sp. K7]
MIKKLITLLLIIFSTQLVEAQDIALGNGQKYTIGKITVTGTTNYNESTVIAYTGLKTGQSIYIPGDRLSNVIKKLWDLELFSDVNIYVVGIQGTVANLEIEIKELPTIGKITLVGIKNRKSKKEKFLKDYELKTGTKITENLITTTENKIEKDLAKKGHLFAEATITTKDIPADTISSDEGKKVEFIVNVDKKDKVKIANFNIEGNEVFSDAKVRRQFKTKRRNFLRFWKRSKFIEEDYEAGKQKLIEKYKSKGYRDARIVADTMTVKNDKAVELAINLEEGDKYYFGNISFLGNTVYTDQQLRRVLGIAKGDTYNGTLLDKKIADIENPEANDITNLYQNNGYLFAQINPVETKVYNDTIDFEIRIYEGKLAYFDKITVTGNDKTNDHVIYRNLRTKPGQIYSKQDVVRTVRELGATGFFNAEKLSPDFNVNPADATVDLNYHVEEAGASQIQLQGGYGGGGFVGTLGLSFNNFSIKGIFDKDAYKPLPMGDGQTLSLQAQAATFYQTYSLSFSEPWLGGKKPIRLSTSFSYSKQFQFDFVNRDVDRSQNFNIIGGSIGLAKRLTIPDDFFTASAALSFQYYDLNNFQVARLFRFENGSARNFALTLGLTRDNTYTNPIFPMGGSSFGITAKLTPPYSAFNGVDYANLENQEEFQNVNGSPNYAAIDQEKYKWLEYYKVKFNANWYNNLFAKLVLRTGIELGYLGAYNQDRGIPPFERFFLGGDGLGGYSLDGRENIRLRGYPNQSVYPASRTGTITENSSYGAPIYNKFSLELRYPITLKPQASIFTLAFAEGGASYDSFREYNPFLLNRSAGLGLRIFMPAFGMLGIDFGYGFDPIPGTESGANGWETHFIIGQQF